MAISKITQKLLGEEICRKANLNELWHGTAIALFTIVAVVFFPLFIYLAIIAKNTLLFTALTSFWVLSIATYVYMIKSRSIERAAILACMICLLLFFYLIITGAANNTGMLWCYAVVPALFQMLGAKKGTIAIALLIAGASIIFYVPSLGILQADYTPTQMSRFIFSFLGLSILSFVHEYSRTQTNKRLHELKEQFKQASHIDTLTQLANRREARNRLDLIESFIEDPNYICSVVICDIDHFKQINDNYGHECGDYVLVQLAKIFTQLTREGDLVVRWGGEEFLLIFPETSPQQAVDICSKIKQHLAETEFEHQDYKIKLSLSFGISSIDKLQSTRSALVKADHALYAAKNNGRNCIIVDSLSSKH